MRESTCTVSQPQARVFTGGMGGGSCRIRLASTGGHATTAKPGFARALADRMLTNLGQAPGGRVSAVRPGFRS
jgi:hypothetical protein